LLAFPALAGEADKVELGRRLFMDPTVSRGGKFSCASCHDPEHGFSDPRRLSEDENGPTRRHSQPMLDLGEQQPLHWDGEFQNVRQLLMARLAPPAVALDVARFVRTARFTAAQESGREPDAKRFQETISRLTPPYYGPVTTPGSGPIPVPLLLRLEEDDRYADGFRRAFGTKEIRTERLIEALHAYVLSVRTGESPFDRYRKGDPEALTASQRRGLALFTGKANCASCHTIEAPEDDRPRLTDDRFHNTGVALRSAALTFGGGLDVDGGAGEMSFVAEDLGRFKTPSLRDVALHPPYMHDGSFETLEDVVRYYDRGGTPNRHLSAHVRPLELSRGEVQDLVAFLHSLTGDRRAGLGPARAGERHVRLRIVDLRGKPLKELPVEVQPAGDRLEGAPGREPPQLLTTDRHGKLSFVFPAWTHVRLVSPGYEIHYDWLLPDYTAAMTVMAAPRERAVLKVRVAPGMSLPATLTARRPDGKDFVARFERVRKLDEHAAIYAGERRRTPGPFLAVFDIDNTARELDLSGGWEEPLDLRPPPQ
jgi:cytochrome c peroxidase